MASYSSSKSKVHQLRLRFSESFQKTTWQSLNVDHADDGEAGASEQSLEADHDDTQEGAFALTFKLS